VPLTLVIGRANSGKTGALHDAIVREAISGRRSTLLLPSSAEMRRARAELSKKAPVGVEISTLDRWIEALWTDLGDGRRFVSRIVRNALLVQAIKASRPTTIAESAQTPGFAEILALVVARLCNSSSDMPAPSREMREIRDIISRYEHLVGTLGLIEPARAAAAMAEQDVPGLGLVVVNRFSDLSEGQERILVAASVHSDVRVGLAWQRGFPATESLTSLVGRLVEQGAAVVECAQPDSDDELALLEARLYRGVNPAQIEPTGRVELCCAAGAEAEIELVAQTVEQSIAAGAAADRIAIVFRRPGGRARRLSTALEERAVDLDVDIVLTLGQTDYGRALLGLLTAAAGEGSRTDVLAFLSSPYSGVDGGDVAELDRRWRRSRTSDARKMLDAVARSSDAAGRAVRAARKAIGTDVSDAAVNIWKDLADALLEAAFAARGSRAGAVAAPDIADTAAHRSVVRAVLEAAQLDGAISGIDLALSLPDAAVSTRSAERAGAVQMLDVTRARSRRFDVLILAGLTAEEFSAEKPEPLQARIERHLGGRGGTEERLSERMLFYTLVTRARERLVLVRQSSDSAGESIRPSVFWEDVVDLYVSANDAGELPPLPPDLPQSALLLSEVSAAVPAFSRSRRDMRRLVERGERVLQHPLSATLVLEGEGVSRPRPVFSVTELEVYAQCPYRWFLERGVRPKDIDAALDAREMGTRAHEMLALFYRRLPDRLGVGRVDPSTVEDALALFEEVADEVEADRRDGGAVSLSEELDMAVARQRARSVVEDDATFLAGYRPEATEWEFSIEVESGSGAALLRGKVDRIDVGPQGVVVTDYKLGSKVHGLAGWQRQRLLQIPLYAWIASNSLDEPVAGGIYRSLASLDARGFWRADLCVPLGEGHAYSDGTDREGMEAALTAAQELAFAAIHGILEGAIEPEPATKESCTYCLAATFCPKVMC
jgi:PD-(D/E)XK nuclease superfamily